MTFLDQQRHAAQAFAKWEQHVRRWAERNGCEIRYVDHDYIEIKAPESAIATMPKLEDYL